MDMKILLIDIDLIHIRKQEISMIVLNDANKLLLVYHVRMREVRG